MSLRAFPGSPIPEDTVRVARAAFPKGNRYMQMHDALGSIYSDGQFAGLFSQTGQPAEAGVFCISPRKGSIQTRAMMGPRLQCLANGRCPVDG